MELDAPAPLPVRRDGPVSRLARWILKTPSPRWPLATAALPLRDLERPAVLAFPLRAPGARAAVKVGDVVQAGDALGTAGSAKLCPSPVAGKVVAVQDTPDVRGGKPGPAVLLEPAGEAPAPLPPLDPEHAEVAELRSRLAAAAIAIPHGAQLVVLAVDREPALSAAQQLLRERSVEVARAAALAGRVAGATRVVLAVTEPLAALASEACGAGIEVLAVPAVHPETLEPLLLRRLPGPAVVTRLETALAALDAIASGRLQERKALTVIGGDGQVRGNFRVAVGSRVGDVLAALGLEVGAHDKVVAGGPFLGVAQQSLDAAIDSSVDGLMLMPAGSFGAWSDEPCINCGACIDACPERLQVQLIGRYTEFDLFERAAELGVEHCFECGLCASVCTTRRPLVQLIRLAKRELAAKVTSARG